MNNRKIKPKFKKLKTSIKVTMNGKDWFTWIDGDENSINNSWNAMCCGYCNDDIIKLIREYEKTIQPVWA